MIDLFFVHQGNSDYLRYSLGQAKKACPGSKIYLLGDSTNDLYPFVEHSKLADYLDDQFSEHYCHLSENSFHYELFCFNRWFAVRNFVRQHKEIQQFMCLDSDVLLYHDVNLDSERYRKFELTVTDRMGPQFAYFNGLDAIESFCNFILDHYRVPELLSRLKNEFELYKSSADFVGGGICDMRLFARYSTSFPGRVLDLAWIHEGSVFDSNMNSDQGFEWDDQSKLKKLVIRRGAPYLKLRETGDLVRLNGAHFQGGAKGSMRRHYRGIRYGYLFRCELDEYLSSVREGVLANLRKVPGLRSLKRILEKGFGQ